MEFTCSNCGFSSFSKLIYQEHSCQGDSSRWKSYQVEVREEIVDPHPVAIATPVESTEDVGLPGMVADEDDYRDPQSAPFRCICGFSAFSQMLYEDHECKFVMREAVRASVRASTTSRLKDVGLHHERVGMVSTKQGPQTVLVKTRDSGKVLFGPRPLEKETTVAKLRDRILEVRKQPWASMKFYHKESELAAELFLHHIPEQSLLLLADINSATLDIQVKKNYFNKFPDVVTEVQIAPQSEEEYEADVRQVRENLKTLLGRYRTLSEEINSIDGAALMATIEERPRNLSCVPFSSCLSAEQFSQLQIFLQKAKTARLWKHEAFGQHYLMAWTAGHKLRLSIISEDLPTRSYLGRMGK
ncbi:unnamed protein product [Durusdinium trenchii]|uniref:Uncharacterized protein n=2 Tax=Durusdinium trenchii TaxID=1381693 RepID=A0ABP0KDC1_9DINO